ncbi:unnamed protein product [Diatraea saccharalis]|uniref:Kinetochore protein NDC80 n=1 Tax=Diatraea saccharalis TaxID=40085 RepID=A0A9N9WHP7_9NEOP|nr:unnamed protein product [Diatraea saccharalis]
MLPTRYVPGQSSVMRKSRLEGKPSLLPKPRRPGSTDRLSAEARRPSTTGQRSSSAEPRGTFGPGRLSREASQTKIQSNGRSRSQQSERFGQTSMTPLRSSHYSVRPTTTPVRTPSEDRSSRSWQTSLDRALAFVTIKDQRPISNAGWQRAELARVQEALSRRGGAGSEGGGMALIRPLTIARFVDIAGALLNAITRDAKLNNDNYVTKLPHLSKRLLYPGTVSKSWLKTVNTLHAFPHALALIAYLLDLANHIEMPVSDDWLYVGKDELAQLRRDYLYKCWIRFQDPGHQFEDLNEEYLENLKVLLGNDEEKIMELQQIINKYTACLEDEVEAAAREDEARRTKRRDALLAEVRAVRAARAALRANIATAHAHKHDLTLQHHHHDQDIERATLESQQLKRELEDQPLSMSERARLLDEIDYAHRVQDSKRSLAQQIEKMVASKEVELAQWQMKTLDSCVEYKQGLIHLTAEFPDLASLAIDEKELMGVECAALVSRAVEALKDKAADLNNKRALLAAQRTKLTRHRTNLMEEARAKIAELKSSIEREQHALDEETNSEVTEAAACSDELAAINATLEALRANQAEYKRIEAELEFWEKQDALWQSQLSSLREYIASQRAEVPRLLEEACARRVKLIKNAVTTWQTKLERSIHTNGTN